MRGPDTARDLGRHLASEAHLTRPKLRTWDRSSAEVTVVDVANARARAEDQSLAVGVQEIAKGHGVKSPYTGGRPPASR